MDEYTRKRIIRKIREAYNVCKIQSITLFRDGSGAEFIYTDPVGNHGMPCLMSSSLNIEDTMKAMAGMRLRIGDIPTTLKIEK
jgi:hypothetical protein